MKKNVPYLFFGLLFNMAGLHALKAQNKAPNILQLPPANLKIDGSLDEWGDSLRYYNEEKKLNFTLANDQENLYMAIRFNDRSEQMRVLGAGLTLSINTKGKKKETFTITFPVAEKGSMGMGGPSGFKRNADGDNSITQQDRDELAKARLTKLRDIKVSGFKDIEGDIITTTNTYGIKAAINYDANGYLVYETAIPIKFFHEDKPGKTEWAFNFKINGLSKPSEGGGQREGGGGMGGGGGRRGGMGGGGGRRGGGGGGMGGGGRGGMRGGRGGNSGEAGGTDRSELFKSIDFWEKYYLKVS